MAVGILAGAIAFRRRSRRNVALALGVLAAIALATLWHGPLGAADRLAGDIERRVHATMVFYEIPQVSGHLHHAPLTRHVTLAGPADDFQRSELVRLVNDISGVSGTSWERGGGGVPLIAEAAAAALLGYLLGLLVAYLVELRRRYNAQWTW
jgi:hypothetical protein